MNPLFYEIISQKKLPAAAAPVKEIKYKVRKEVRKGRIVYIQTPIIEEKEEAQPEFNMYR
jgi:RecG-like helicase